jgi:hypothetical protein
MHLLPFQRYGRTKNPILIDYRSTSDHM